MRNVGALQISVISKKDQTPHENNGNMEGLGLFF
jgi:hypothetical protein